MIVGLPWYGYVGFVVGWVLLAILVGLLLGNWFARQRL